MLTVVNGRRADAFGFVHDSTTFSDFYKKPIPFEDYETLLFKKALSNSSFKVGDEVVYVISGILTLRNEWFRLFFKGKTISLESQLIINGIDVDVFKMIIQWIYTYEIRGLNEPSPSLLNDLERVYVAARKYEIIDLCDPIESYLKSLVTERNFGEIRQIANRIDCKSLQRAVFREWIAHSEEFNKNDDQIVLALDRIRIRDVVEDVKNDVIPPRPPIGMSHMR
jgi:hypothetical protein